MLKVYLIVFGLVAVVPSSDQKSVDILLLKTEGFASSMAGAHVSPHEALAAFRIPGVGVNVHRFSSDDLVLALGNEQAGFQMNLANVERFPRIDRIVGPGKVEVKSGCLSGKLPDDCVVDGRELLAGRVKLSGGWTLQPVEVIERNPEPKIVDRSIWGFRTLGSPPKIHDLSGEFSNGFMFTTSIPKSELLTIKAGGGSFFLSPEPESDCKAFDPAAPNCAIVIVRNVGRDNPSPDHGTGNKDESKPCDEMNLKTAKNLLEDKTDIHFEAIYGLLEGSISERFVPFLKLEEIRIEKPGDPPGSKCFGTYVLQ